MIHDRGHPRVSRRYISFTSIESIFLFLLEQTLSFTEHGLEIIEDSLVPFCAAWVDHILKDAPANGHLTTSASDRLLLDAAPDLLCGEGGSSSYSPTPANGPEFNQDAGAIPYLRINGHGRPFELEDFLSATSQLQQVCLRFSQNINHFADTSLTFHHRPYEIVPKLCMWKFLRTLAKF
jgi:hypothetical protein